MVAPRRARPFARSVFVNCPFDKQYLPILHAILFAIHDCRFVARTALEDVGGGESRLDKIARLIRVSRYSVHDLSRVEISRSSPLPRFNMPLECGIALGAILYLPRRSGLRDLLFLTAQPYDDKRLVSDLSGLDGAHHENKPDLAIAAVRRFLANKVSGTGELVLWTAAIARRFKRFKEQLPEMASKAKTVSAREVVTLDYLGDWLTFATAWQSRTP